MPSSFFQQVVFPGGFFLLFRTERAHTATLWQKTYGGANNDGSGVFYAVSIQETSDGGYIVAGRTSSFGAGGGDVWIMKLDSNGNVLWQKTYGGADGEWAYSIQETSDGGYIVAGETLSFGAGGSDVWIMKLSPNGDFPSCSTGSSQVSPQDTNVNPQDSNADVNDTNVVGSDTNVEPADTSSTVTTLCIHELRPPFLFYFTANPDTGFAPLTTTFSWYVYSLEGYALTCYIDVDNDGVNEYTINNCAINTSQNHTYSTAGTYTAKLTVNDGKGGTTSKTVNVNVTVNAIVNYTLTVNKTGMGSGTVTSNPVGIDCGDSCRGSYAKGASVTLTATPDPGSVFAGWSGDCSACESDTTCKITMNSDKTCTAVFDLQKANEESNTGSSEGSGGCSMTSGVSPVNLLAWLVVPALVMLRRLRRV